MKAVLKMYISVKKKCRAVALILAIVLVCSAVLVARNEYSNTDFGTTFGRKAVMAKARLAGMLPLFETCAATCKTDSRFMQAIVFPEVMRYSSLKDGIEAESLRTLYVQLGKSYANFSIGPFQMKPSFAEEVEDKVRTMLPDSLGHEFQLWYKSAEEETIRAERIERLQDEQWQLVYLTAFICICNELYKNKKFADGLEKVQWYATLYNAGFDKTPEFIASKIKTENFYLQQKMPEKKFRYAAIAGWFYQTDNN